MGLARLTPPSGVSRAAAAVAGSAFRPRPVQKDMAPKWGPWLFGYLAIWLQPTAGIKIQKQNVAGGNGSGPAHLTWRIDNITALPTRLHPRPLLLTARARPAERLLRRTMRTGDATCGLLVGCGASGSGSARMHSTQPPNFNLWRRLPPCKLLQLSYLLASTGSTSDQ